MRALALLVLLMPALGRGDEPSGGQWSDGLTPERAAPLVPIGNWSVLVAEAGSRGRELLAMTAALREALRQTGRTRAVLDAAPLGSLAGLDERGIVARAATLPIDLVLMVRLSEAGDAPAAGITVYRPSGEILARFLVSRGQPPRRIAVTRLGSPDADRESLADRTLFFEARDPHRNLAEMGPRLGLVTARELSPEQFYSLAGHPELATQYRYVRDKQLMMRWGGVAALGLGVAVLGGTYNYLQSEQEVGYVVALALGLTGGGLLFGQLAYHPFPVSSQQAIDMADRYNRRTAKGYGVDDPGPQSRAPAAPGGFVIAPYVARSSGGLQAAITF